MRTRILAGLGLALAMAAVTFVRGDGGGDATAYEFTGGDDRAELARGEWRIVAVNGMEPIDKLGEMRMIFKDGKLSTNTKGGKGTTTGLPLRLNLDTAPRQIEWQTKAGKILGIYQLDRDRDTLKIAFSRQERPADFTPGPDKTVYVLKRVRP